MTGKSSPFPRVSRDGTPAGPSFYCTATDAAAFGATLDNQNDGLLFYGAPEASMRPCRGPTRLAQIGRCACKRPPGGIHPASGPLSERVSYSPPCQSQKESRNRNLKIGRSAPFFRARPFGHRVLVFSHSFSYEKAVRRAKSNVPGPWPGTDERLFVTGGSPDGTKENESVTGGSA